MKKVAIVVGHGPKHDTGAVNKDGTTELIWNRDLARRIQKALEGRLDAVIVNRVIEQLQPVKETNETGADMTVELHLNDSGTGKASGSEMIHALGSKKGPILAGLLQQAAVDTLGLPNRGIKTPWMGRGRRWLEGTKMPAVIVESFFIDNSDDLRRGNLKKQKLAEAYADALVAFGKTL